MNDESHAGADDAVVFTAKIVTAFVSNNAIAVSDISRVIGNVYGAVVGLGQPVVVPAVELVPAVSIRKSVTPDFIICLEDGKKFKSMRKHLSGLGMTPDEYRAKWGLPADYPIVAPNYSAARSAMALSIGLGRKSAPLVTLGKRSNPAKKTAKPK
jgi:predicted transcriptional regulator